MTKIPKQPMALRRTEIREILHRNKGSIGQIAEDLGITSQAISVWLAGRTTSERVARAAEAKALSLLKQEQSHAA